jgi:hypothetical protein
LNPIVQATSDKTPRMPNGCFERPNPDAALMTNGWFRMLMNI